MDNPKDAVDDLGKYELEAFDSSYINIRIREYLTRAQKYLTDSDAAVEISTSFEAFVNMRKILFHIESVYRIFLCFRLSAATLLLSHTSLHMKSF